MTWKVITLTRKEYDVIAKSRGINEPQKISTEGLLDSFYRYYIKREVKINHGKLNKINLKKIARKKIYFKKWIT